MLHMTEDTFKCSLTLTLGLLKDVLLNYIFKNDFKISLMLPFTCRLYARESRFLTHRKLASFSDE